MSTPSQESRRTAFRPPAKLLKGADAFVHGLAGAYRRRSGALSALRQRAERIAALARDWESLNDHQLQERLLGFRDQFRRGGRAAAGVREPAMAAVREAARRQTGLHPFLEQIMGALALYDGYLVEMATGEGKTLTAGLAGVLRAWSRRACHVITVNDYLVERDAEWMKSLYHFCGVRVGVVTAPMPPEDRRKGYAADITYTTSKEVVADFLRDCLRVGPLRHTTRRLIRGLLGVRGGKDDGLVMRGLHAAIVDEGDSILIDEAVTPLILSAPRKNEMLQQVIQAARQVASPLESPADYTVNPRYREVELTREGQRKLEHLCASLPGVWRGPARRTELIKQALVAREFYHRDRQYIVHDGRIVIVDEFTGRQMPMRTWRQGMHQAIEAKEDLSISEPNETIARISFQRYFRLYEHLAGMTGTGREAAGEFWQIYRLPVVTIPTHRPCIRREDPDRIFASDEEKWSAVVEEVRRLHGEGRPVLVGTRSVVASENLARRLEVLGLPFKLLNAVRHAEEALIVAVAGERSRITIATNMAGRGTDIRLGEGVAQAGGLHVLATERHESRRVDRQLFGRSARQGDPGSAQALVSVEDELLRRHLPRAVRERVERALRKGGPWGERLARWAFHAAQLRAQRMAFKMRRGVLRTDDWMDESLAFAGGETGDVQLS